jgi:cell division protein FtsL
MATAPPGRAAVRARPRPNSVPAPRSRSGSRSSSRPATRPRPQAKRKSAQLRVIRGGRESAQTVPAGKITRVSLLRPAPGLTFVALATSIVAICVFGVVLIQVMLAQTSFELQKVHEQLVTEETKYRHMRFEVANAEAPAKIHEAAARLGLVVPAEQRYVFGPDSPAPKTDSTQQAEGPNDKAGLKAVLSKQP